MKRKIAIALSAVLLGSFAAGELPGSDFPIDKANRITLVDNPLMPAVAAAADNDEDKEQKGRFIYLFSDDGFNYYLDSVSSCRTTPPSGSAKLLEVWIKLLPLGLAPETEVVIDQTYFLQHYMLWPDREQIMFLSELEVEGRPDNYIKERPFDGRNWEKLVPGSLEDNIYRECMKYRSSLKKRGPQTKTTSKIGDVLEDTFHISL